MHPLPTFAAVFAKPDPLFVPFIFFCLPLYLLHSKICVYTSSTYSNKNFIKLLHEQSSSSAKADNDRTSRAYQGHLTRDDSALAAETLILSSFFDGNKASAKL